jgi:hypothetical protein
MKVVHVEHGKEPLILLSHMSNEVVYEKGLRNQLDTSELVLYRLRIDSKYGTLRACNISTSTPTVSQSDSYFIIHNTKASLIKRSSTPSSEIDHLYHLCQTILSRRKLFGTNINTIDSSTPWKEFPNFNISSTSSNQFDNAVFFRCSCSLGYFSIEHLGAFSQEDLRSDCVVILDCRPGPFFLWKGCEASDVVIHLTFKAIDLRKSRNGVKDDCHIIIIEQGKEPHDFIMYFNVWEDQTDLEPSNSFLNRMKELKV